LRRKETIVLKLFSSGVPKAQTFDQRLNRIVSEFDGTDAHGAKDELLEVISDHNKKTDALLAKLAILANLARIKKDPAKVELAKELTLALDMSPKMSESVANIYRPQFGGSYRHLRSSYWKVARHTKLNPNKIARKRAARLFAMKLGMRVPEQFQDGVPHRDIVIRSPCVVKPLSEDGGVGVHAIVERDGTFVDLFDKEKSYASLDELKARFASLLAQKKVRVDEWLVEELILPPSGSLADSRDLKFFAFYGEIGYVLQIDRWSKERPVRAMFTPEGKAVDVSTFYSIPKQPFEPTFSQNDIDYISKLSSQLPWPGIRIDVLNGKDGLVFGEFTVNPGAYGGFHDEPDQFLGNLWAKAAGGIHDDLLLGKKFTTYCEFLQELSGITSPF
jgi:TupA-like ATPgrasp